MRFGAFVPQGWRLDLGDVPAGGDAGAVEENLFAVGMDDDGFKRRIGQLAKAVFFHSKNRFPIRKSLIILPVSGSIRLVT